MGATTRPLARNVFALTDAMDVENLVSLFRHGRASRLGNGQPMSASTKSAGVHTPSYETIASLHHDIVKEWNVGDDTINRAEGHHGRKDGQQVTIPCTTIFHTDSAGKIDDYRVYFDVMPIYA